MIYDLKVFIALVRFKTKQGISNIEKTHPKEQHQRIEQTKKQNKKYGDPPGMSQSEIDPSNFNNFVLKSLKVLNPLIWNPFIHFNFHPRYKSKVTK